jgi:hypothetical protein
MVVSGESIGEVNGWDDEGELGVEQRDEMLAGKLDGEWRGKRD